MAALQQRRARSDPVEQGFGEGRRAVDRSPLRQVQQDPIHRRVRARRFTFMNQSFLLVDHMLGHPVRALVGQGVDGGAADGGVGPESACSEMNRSALARRATCTRCSSGMKTSVSRVITTL